MNTEHRTQNTEHRTQNTEKKHRTQNTEHRRVTVDVVRDRCRQRVDVEVVAQRVATGFVFTEGPVLVDEEQCLLSLDSRGGVRAHWSATERCRTVGRNTHNANGMTRHLDGDLIVYVPASSRLARISLDCKVFDRREIASRYVEGTQQSVRLRCRFRWRHRVHRSHRWAPGPGSATVFVTATYGPYRFTTLASDTR